MVRGRVAAGAKRKEKLPVEGTSSKKYSKTASTAATGSATGEEVTKKSSETFEMSTKTRNESEKKNPQDGSGTDKKEETSSAQNKRSYALRRSTVNSSRTAPWYKRYLSAAEKAAANSKFDTLSSNKTPSLSNLNAFPDIKSGEIKGKAKSLASKLRQPKKGNLKTSLRGLKLKFLPVGTSSFASLKKNVNEPANETQNVPKKTDEKRRRGKEAVTQATATFSQSSQLSHGNPAQANLQTYSHTGHEYTTPHMTHKRSSVGPRLTAREYQPSRYSSTPSDAGTSTTSEDSDESGEQTKRGDNQPFASRGRRATGDGDGFKGPPEKKLRFDPASLNLKLKMEPSGSYAKDSISDGRESKSRQEKKAKLITPYQILKGKELQSEKSTSIILKRKTVNHEKEVKYPYDWKGKLVTPYQILKGKERTAETSASYARKTNTGADAGIRNRPENIEIHEPRASYSEAGEGTSASFLSQRREDGSESIAGPSHSGKYEADTTSSPYYVSHAKSKAEEIEAKRIRRAKKKEKKARRERRERRREKIRKAMKEKLREDEDTVTSSYEERERAALNFGAVGREAD